MFILASPILTIVSVLSVAFFYALVIGAQRTALIRQICLVASFVALFVGVLAALSFDKAAVGYQYMSTFSFTAEYNSAFALGVDGLSYVFLILTLFTFPFLFLAA
jgi:NADH:ubiquinone oxidoreductase subunit 4 (subunit M)